MTSLLRRAVSFILFQCLVKRKIRKIDHVRMFGLQLTVPPTVFHPALYFTSRYFGKYLLDMDIPSQTRVLDVGCGSGILSLIAARNGATVTAIDINPAAVHATELNATENNLLHQISIFESDLLNSLDPGTERFQLIILNPPFYSGTPSSMAGRAWYGGTDQDFTRKFLRQASHYLEPDGRVLFILSSDANVQEVIDLFTSAHFQTALKKSRRFLFERLYIFEAIPS